MGSRKGKLPSRYAHRISAECVFGDKEMKHLLGEKPLDREEKLALSEFDLSSNVIESFKRNGRTVFEKIENMPESELIELDLKLNKQLKFELNSRMETHRDSVSFRHELIDYAMFCLHLRRGKMLYNLAERLGEMRPSKRDSLFNLQHDKLSKFIGAFKDSFAKYEKNKNEIKIQSILTYQYEKCRWEQLKLELHEYASNVAKMDYSARANEQDHLNAEMDSLQQVEPKRTVPGAHIIIESQIEDMINSDLRVYFRALPKDDPYAFAVFKKVILDLTMLNHPPA